MSLFDFRREIPIPTAHTITKRLCMVKICMIFSLVQLSCVNKQPRVAAKYPLKVAEHFRAKVRVSVQGVEALWGDCRFIPADWGS